mgnify:FL=1
MHKHQSPILLSETLHNMSSTAIADKKYEKPNKQSAKDELITVIKKIKPNDITDIDFDYILLSNENPKSIINFLIDNLHIKREIIKPLFIEEIYDEATNYNYLCKFNFKENLKQLSKKLKNKKVILYGAGAYLELIDKCYDLSQLNIIGVSDIRFEYSDENDKFLQYRVISPNKLNEIEFDYLLISTKMYMGLMYNLYCDTCKDAKYKLKPLVKKPIINLLKEFCT